MVDKSHKAKLGTANESCHENTESKKNITKKKENDLLMNIPDDKLEIFFKYQYFNLRFQETKLEWDSIWIIPESKSIVNIEVKLVLKKKEISINFLKMLLIRQKSILTSSKSCSGVFCRKVGIL